MPPRKKDGSGKVIGIVVSIAVVLLIVVIRVAAGRPQLSGATEGDHVVTIQPGFVYNWTLEGDASVNYSFEASLRAGTASVSFGQVGSVARLTQQEEMHLAATATPLQPSTPYQRTGRVGAGNFIWVVTNTGATPCSVHLRYKAW